MRFYVKYKQSLNSLPVGVNVEFYIYLLQLTLTGPVGYPAVYRSQTYLLLPIRRPRTKISGQGGKNHTLRGTVFWTSGNDNWTYRPIPSRLPAVPFLADARLSR